MIKEQIIKEIKNDFAGMMIKSGACYKNNPMGEISNIVLRLSEKYKKGIPEIQSIINK